MSCRAACYRPLLVASRLLLILATGVLMVVLSAGTFVDLDDQGVSLTTLAFKSLAMVSYDGIVPNPHAAPNQTRLAAAPEHDFLFTMYRFPNAFAWECLGCPPAVHSTPRRPEFAGVAEVGPDSGSDPRALMLQIIEAAGPTQRQQPSLADCFGGRQALPGCPDSVFFEAWRPRPAELDLYQSPSPWSWLQTHLVSLTYGATFLLVALVLASEVLMARAPRLMRCRCLVLKGWCPYPKGSRAEIEALPEHAWDRVRARTYPLASAYFLLLVQQGALLPRLLLDRLQRVDRRLPEGMSMRPRQHGLYMWLLWGSFAMSALASALVLVRYRLGRPKGRIVLDDLADIEPLGDQPAKGERGS